MRRKCLLKHKTTEHETGNLRRGRMNARRSTVSQQMSCWMLQLLQPGLWWFACEVFSLMVEF